MSSDKKLKWLKIILAAKVFFSVFVWGLPFLFAPMSYFQGMGVPVPEDPLFIRFMGAMSLAFAVAYWYAYKDPIRNIAIVRVGVVDNGLVSMVNLIFFVFYDLKSVVMLASGTLIFLFFLSFLLLIPKTENA